MEKALIIKTNDLTLGYNGKTVINGVSMEIEKGSICCIIGPNGCGKSTLLKALSRNLKIINGTIKINDKNIKHYPTRQLAKKMAYLTQTPYQPEQFSVRDLVSYGRFPHTGWFNILKPYDHEVIDWAMEITETAQFAERELNHLSGGERQRVRIAMALAQEAEILLLDEPTTYLDIAHQFQILELIHKLNKEMGRTILIVLHDLNQAARYAEHLIVLKDGKITARGMPKDIINEDLLKEVFFLESRVIQDETNNCPFFIPIRGGIKS